jgi:LacI family transcriptional regulator
MAPRIAPRRSFMNYQEIALYIDRSIEFGRGIIRGLKSYARPRKPWRFNFPNERLDRSINFSGVIVLNQNLSEDQLRRFQKARVPVVVLALRPKWRGPCIATDNTEVGRQVAKYFLDRGFKHFGVLGDSNVGPSHLRCEVFKQSVEAAGYRCAELDRPFVRTKESDQKLGEWLQKLPKPAAVFAFHDQAGWLVSETCYSLGIRVPEDIAIMGADNDEVYCELSHPPLSSIRLPTEQMGYEAGAMLDRIMSGGKVPKNPLLLPPVGIVTRQSSDILAIKDEDVAAALRFINNNAENGIGVDDILRAVPISRRSLERKFREMLKRSPQEEIHRVRIEHARNLLSTSDQAIDQIALASGFQSHDRFGAIFKKSTGLTPREFRRRYQINKHASYATLA